MANDEFLNPLDALIPKIPSSFFAEFWVRVTSGARGSVSVGFWGVPSIEPPPFFSLWGRLARRLYRPTPSPAAAAAAAESCFQRRYTFVGTCVLCDACRRASKGEEPLAKLGHEEAMQSLTDRLQHLEEEKLLLLQEHTKAHTQPEVRRPPTIVWGPYEGFSRTTKQ